MRLTLYTDYTLRVMMYLAAAWPLERVCTIDDIARAYDISRNHLTKIVNELAQQGFVQTVRGRAGGARLARPPEQIRIGAIVRMAEKDFAVVSCHDPAVPQTCAVRPACNLQRAMARAVEAFMAELDAVTLADAITAPETAASLLGLATVQAIRFHPGGPGAAALPVDPGAAALRVGPGAAAPPVGS